MSERLTCPDPEELAAWIDGTVDAATRSRLAAHVADCARCADVVEGVLEYDEESELVRNVTADDVVDDFDPAQGGYQPMAPRVRWKPYLAAALMVCAMVVGLRLIEDRSPGLATLRQELRDLEDRTTTRSATNPLTDEEVPIARKCRLFLKSKDTALDNEVLTGCLDLVARDPDLASEVVVEAPGFAEWLSSPDSLGDSSCQVLETAWEHLRRARQEELRPHRERCRASAELEVPGSEA